MENIIVKWADPIPEGKYTASKTLTTIEDPRKAEYDNDNLMKGTEWETHKILRGKEFEITGHFKYRNKLWYLVKNGKAKKQQTINHIAMLNTILKPQF